MNWFAEQRQFWIAEMLMIYEYINREHLERKFRISKPQASSDLQIYVKANPDTVIYNSSSKRYEIVK
jgi:hypothetical protein